MNWTLVPLASAAPQAWRNGGGVTRELLAGPAAADWRVRMSVADVERAGPFSPFPGVERWFAVLEGEGVVLRMADGEHRLTRGSEPLRFDGAAPVDCSLITGSTRDFNLMTAAGGASMQRVRDALAVATRGPALLAVYAHSRPASVTLAAADISLPAFHLAWIRADAAATGRVRGDDALWMEAPA